MTGRNKSRPNDHLLDWAGTSACDRPDIPPSARNKDQSADAAESLSYFSQSLFGGVLFISLSTIFISQSSLLSCWSASSSLLAALQYDSTGTMANAMTVFGRKFFLHVTQLRGYYQVRRWLRPYNGWMHLPYETRGVLPRFICFWWWHAWKPLPGLLCFLIVITVPPFKGDSDLIWQLDLWSQLTLKRMTVTSMKAHDELTWEDSERDFVVDLRPCTACRMLG